MQSRTMTIASVCLNTLAVALFATGGWAGAASAQESATSHDVPAVSAWSLSFTTYSWLPWLTGENSVRGRTLEIDATPRDIIGALDWSTLPTWMSYAEARHGHLTLFNDIVYSKLAGASGFQRSRQGRLLAGTVSADVEADFQQLTVELGAAYEIWASNGGSLAGHTAIDLLAGGRYWRQEVDVSVNLAASATLDGPLGITDLTLSGNRVFAKSGSVDWVDPFIGARLRYDVDAAQSVLIRGDIGGFGIGSDFTWQALATYNWQMCVTDTYKLDAYVGYRALSVDYSEGAGNSRYEFDALQHGPVLGATARF